MSDVKDKGPGGGVRSKEGESRPVMSPSHRLLIMDLFQKSGLPLREYSQIVGVPYTTLSMWRSRFEKDGPEANHGVSSLLSHKGGPKSSKVRKERTDPTAVSKSSKVRKERTDPTAVSFDDLMDPDGRKYQTNTDTGEIRYEGDSNPDSEGGIWSGWRDPDNLRTDASAATQDEYRKNDAMKELHDFLNEFESATARIEKYQDQIERGLWLEGLGLRVGGSGLASFTYSLHILKTKKASPIAGIALMGTSVVAVGAGSMFIVEGRRLQGY